MLGLAMGLGWIKLPGMVHTQEKNIQMLVFVARLVKKDAYKTPKWMSAQLTRLSLVLRIVNLNMTLLLGVV